MFSKAVAIGLVSAGCVFSQAHFDVASIKPIHLAGEGRNRENIIVNPGSLNMHNVTLKTAVQWAYGVKEYQVSGPGWIGDERYDISAKAATSGDEPQLRAMLQSLLADRFKVVLHHETRILPYYALLVAKNGPKLARGKADGKSVVEPKGTGLSAKDTSMGDVADLLTLIATRMNLPPVVDKTALKGRYNFNVDASDFLQQVGAGNVAPDPSSIITGVSEILQEQLGLKAELRKAPTDVVVVDRAEKTPTEN